MKALLSLPILLPLLGAALSVVAMGSRPVQRVVSVLTLGATTTIAVFLLAGVDSSDAGIRAMTVGGWDAPIGITLVGDRMAALFVLAASTVLLIVAVYAIGERGAERDNAGFHPLYLVLAAGVNLSFLTGDLFNLFVAFEVLLVASYGLLTMGGRDEQTRVGTTYVVLSMLASTLFLFGLALVYGATGTVNMADLVEKMTTVAPAVRHSLAVLFVIVFGLKSAVFPLFFWLPDSYPRAPAPVAAVFAGLLTKVGVAALIRSQTIIFPEGSRPGSLLLWIAGATMVVGVLGAMAQADMGRLLSFHIVSQIGYMVMGLGLFTVAGVAGAIFFVVHQMAIKTGLFLVAGIIRRRHGTTDLDRLGGLARTEPVLAWLFFLPAMSLAGIPPLSGFVGKLALVVAGFDARSWVIVAVALVVGLATLFSMGKIWSEAFWGEPSPAVLSGPSPGAAPPRLALAMGATAVLAVLGIGIVVVAGPMHELTLRAAADLIDPAAYVREVLGP